MLPADLRSALETLGLLRSGQAFQAKPLTGGVSSDIWLLETKQRRFCVKRALPKLKVAQDWFAPLDRNRYEHCWYQLAHQIVPGSAPQVLAADNAALLFAMEYLDPEQHPLWKTELLEGRIKPAFAAQVGERLGRIHAATAHRTDLADAFATGSNFEKLRLEPYLRATAIRHSELTTILQRLADKTAHQQLVLVHGDVSPKNILEGPKGPVFLDAECAWYGDPAFDLAFCLNHLLLKTIVKPSYLMVLQESFVTLQKAYLEQVDWESPAELEARTAALLPGLLLARVDGKSPVEYLQTEAHRELVRSVAVPLLRQTPRNLATICNAWKNVWI
jgi:aminoglycoside phosphotransferase (APT) family kinase protein